MATSLVSTSLRVTLLALNIEIEIYRIVDLVLQSFNLS